MHVATDANGVATLNAVLERNPYSYDVLILKTLTLSSHGQD